MERLLFSLSAAAARKSDFYLWSRAMSIIITNRTRLTTAVRTFSFQSGLSQFSHSLVCASLQQHTRCSSCPLSGLLEEQKANHKAQPVSCFSIYLMTLWLTTTSFGCVLLLLPLFSAKIPLTHETFSTDHAYHTSSTAHPQVHIIISADFFISALPLARVRVWNADPKKGKKCRMSNLVLQTDEHNVAEWFRPTAKTLVTHRAPR